LGEIVGKTIVRGKFALYCRQASLKMLFKTIPGELLSRYPLDAKTKEGDAFWMPPRRPPRPLALTFDDDDVCLFVCFVVFVFARSLCSIRFVD
jgi:ubiquitin-activating enzyme E1